VIAAGHGWGLAVFPLAAGIVAGAFALTLGARFVRRPRPAEGAWTVSLAMFAVASVAMFLGVVRGWHTGDVRVYWLFGAILNVPFLFLGEVYLLAKRRAVGHALLAALVVITAYSAQRVWSARLDVAALGSVLPLGKDVFGDSSTAYRLAQLVAFPAYFLLLAGLLWSAVQMRGRPELRNRTAGAVAIAVGATIVAVGSGVGAGYHIVWLFSVSLAAGVAVMFGGFLRAGRPAPSADRVARPAAAS
jgi:hypothetical protein